MSLNAHTQSMLQSIFPRALPRKAAACNALRHASGTASVNPYTGQTIEEYAYLSSEQASDLVDAAHAAFVGPSPAQGGWRDSSFAERSALMHSLAATLRRNADQYGTLASMEMGKPITEAKAEVEKCAWICEYYAEHAEAFLAPEPVDTGLDTAKGESSYVTFNPIGVVFVIMPWNFPFWQVFRQASTALSAGNTMVLKHAPNVFGCARLIEEAFIEAGFPSDCFRTANIDGPAASDLIDHRHVRAVAFTGSTPVGKLVGARAGGALKPAVLELGGSDPYIILDDADVAHAAKCSAAGRLLNCGQSCIGAKRFVVQDAVHDAFVEALVAEMGAAHNVPADPLDTTTKVGTMATPRFRDGLLEQVRDSLAAGATSALGVGDGDAGDAAVAAGEAVFPPTVLTGVTPGMVAFREELFGPVASVIRVGSERQAVQVANEGTKFGLGSAVFTSDLERGERIARDELESGLAFVNDFVKSDPRMPFGGVKESGLGRECSHYGIKEFVNIKSVVVRS